MFSKLLLTNRLLQVIFSFPLDQEAGAVASLAGQDPVLPWKKNKVREALPWEGAAAQIIDFSTLSFSSFASVENFLMGARKSFILKLPEKNSREQIF